MKKKINNKLTLYFNNLYPYKTKITQKYDFEIILGIGGNIGDVVARFKKLFLTLQNDRRFKIVQTSPILKNPPFGYIEQNDFYNAVIILKTNISALPLLNIMQQYELKFKRTRSFKDAPRTLDIDILYIKQGTKQLRVNHKRLIVPHIGAKIRESVTIPLKCCG